MDFIENLNLSNEEKNEFISKIIALENSRIIKYTESFTKDPITFEMFQKYLNLLSYYKNIDIFKKLMREYSDEYNFNLYDDNISRIIDLIEYQ